MTIRYYHYIAKCKNVSTCLWELDYTQKACVMFPFDNLNECFSADVCSNAEADTYGCIYKSALVLDNYYNLVLKVDGSIRTVYVKESIADNNNSTNKLIDLLAENI